MTRAVERESCFHQANTVDYSLLIPMQILSIGSNGLMISSTSFRLASRQSSEKVSANLPKNLELIIILRYTKNTESGIEVF